MKTWTSYNVWHNNLVNISVQNQKNYKDKI